MLALILHNWCGYFTTYQNVTIHTKCRDFAIKMANHEYIQKSESQKTLKKCSTLWPTRKKTAAKLLMVHKQLNSMVEVEDRPECTCNSEGYTWIEAKD